MNITNNSSKKVFYNTLIIYIRILLTVVLSLYSTRLVLASLGSLDYGIYNLIGGVVSMLAFLNTAMATATQRFLSFELGKKVNSNIKQVYANTIVIHFGIGILIVLFLESFGLILIKYYLNIVPDKISSAIVVFHYMVYTVFLSIISVPFMALLYSHENIIIVAIVTLCESIFKLFIAIFLSYTKSNRIEIYAFLLAVVSSISAFSYLSFTINRYDEFSLKNVVKFKIYQVKELLSFAGWNLFGTLCSMARYEGFAVVLNIFFGSNINAAYGIANQVSSQINFFSVTVLQALNPKIMKSEGADDRGKMIRLALIASKFGFFLLSIIAIPCIFEMKFILQLWLKVVPEYTSVFCSLILISILINQVTIGIQSGLQATGKVKMYQIVVGSLILINIPIAVLLLKLGLKPYSILVSYAIVESIACCMRLYFFVAFAKLNIHDFINNVLKKEMLPLLILLSFSCLVTHLFDFKLRFLFSIPFLALIYLISIYLWGLCDDEKLIIDDILFKKLKR